MGKRVWWWIHFIHYWLQWTFVGEFEQWSIASLVMCVKNLQTRSLFDLLCTQFHHWEHLKTGELIWFNFSLSLHKTIFFWHENKLLHEVNRSKTLEDVQEGEGDKVCVSKDYDMLWNTSQNCFKQWPIICKWYHFKIHEEISHQTSHDQHI